MYGLLAAHPLAPLVSLQHLDWTDLNINVSPEPKHVLEMDFVFKLKYVVNRLAILSPKLGSLPSFRKTASKAQCASGTAFLIFEIALGTLYAAINYHLHCEMMGRVLSVPPLMSVCAVPLPSSRQGTCVTRCFNHKQAGKLGRERAIRNKNKREARRIGVVPETRTAWGWRYGRNGRL